MSWNSDPNDPRRYDDIIGLPHHVSETRPRMARQDRAAQFAPFAALTGFEGVIEDAAERHLADQPEMYSPEEDLL